ncbi:MAG TPA: hypothetical protein VHT97_03590 [Acidimicrobiales bacterium]|jgi:hypothetical protein|nr:hypothetical protein [Acidimicrobiales bacterium]
MERVLAYFAALLLSAAAVAGGVRLTADHTTALDRFKGGTPVTVAPRPTVPAGPAPAPGQAFVKGTVDKLTAEGAEGAPIPAPFTLTAVERGTGKATIVNVLVAGKRTSIAWGGGTPLPITGDGGAIDLGGTKVDIDSTGSSWTVDGDSRPLKPGNYHAGASVAVGLGGLATPKDSVDFTADSQSVITSTGGVVVKIPPAKVDLTGPGKVSASGQLQVRDNKATKPATAIQFGDGPYTVSLTPAAGRFTLDAVLQGPLTST